MLSLVPFLVVSSIHVQVGDSGSVSVQCGDVPVVTGSWFQYYEPGWVKGYFSSRYAPAQVERAPDRTVARSTALGGKVSSVQTVTREGRKVVVESRFEWNGDKPVLVEVCAAEIWAEAVKGQVLADGLTVRSSLEPVPAEQQALEQRQFGAASKSWELRGPVGPLKIRSSEPLVLFDARGYRQDFAAPRGIFFLGALGLESAKGRPAQLRVEFEFPETRAIPASARIEASPIPLAETREADPAPPLLIPRPKEERLRWDRHVVLSGNYTFPAGRVRFLDDFLEGLASRFVLPKPAGPPLALDAGVSKLGIAKGGYRIEITDKSISVLGEEEEGQRNGMRRLAQLAFVKDGKLCLPTGYLRDWPSTEWRGVHLFVGPNAEAFHRRLWRRVLLPMHFNKVVLQLERTDWKATPGIATRITMSKEALARLAAWYAGQQVELIPLIQSFGHMEWLFENGQNLDIAFNPEVPYAVDPRKPRTHELLGQIWDEAIALLRPKTIHFGLDEVDMIGWPDDPQLVTDLWKIQLPALAKIAQKHGVAMMLWGDKALAPGEAADAAHGDSPEHAEARRSVIPRGAYIADWHYKADPDPAVFTPSLDLWKRKGFRPIASGWYAPENVRGLGLAAVQTRAGYLQTTWAGYESSQAAMESNLDQFAAMILAAEYAWSGRKEMPDDLGYRYREQFFRMFFEEPRPIAGRVIRPFQMEPVRLGSLLVQGREGGARSVRLAVGCGAGTLALRLGVALEAGDGERVGDAIMEFADGTEASTPIRYGWHVRRPGDVRETRMAPEGELRIPVAKPIRGVRLEQANSYSGLEIHGLRVIGAAKGS